MSRKSPTALCRRPDQRGVKTKRWASSFQHTFVFPSNDRFNPAPNRPGVKKISRKFFYDPMYLTFLTIMMNPDLDVLDVGANIGVVTRFLAKRTRSTVIAIEPGAKNFKALRINTQDLTNVTLINAAASTSDVVPFCDRGTVNDHVAARNSKRVTPVRGISLDTFLDRRIGLIKLDVEGAELNVLQSGEKLLRKQRPVVACEVDRNWLRRYSLTPEVIVGFFRKLGVYRRPVNKFGQLEYGPRFAKDLFFIPKDLYYPHLYLGYQNLRKGQSRT